jgi:hypothetical protein
VPVQGSPSLARRSLCSATRASEADADRDANDPDQDENTAHAVPVVDGDEHRDSESDQGKTGQEPEGDVALPTLVDVCTVVGLRTLSPPPQVGHADPGSGVAGAANDL